MIKATISAEELQNTLTTIKAAANLLSETALRLVADEKTSTLSILCNGPSSILRVTIPATKVESGSITIPKTLTQKLSSTLVGNIVFESPKGYLLVKTCSGRFKLPYVDERLIDSGQGQSFTGPHTLDKAITEPACRKVAFAAATSFDRPSKAIQTGIAIVATTTGTTFSAHQDFVMALHSTPHIAGTTFEVVIPPKALAVMHRSRDEGSCYFSYNSMKFESPSIYFETVLLSTKPVDLQPVIARFSKKTSWSLTEEERVELRTVVKQMSLFTEGTYHPITIDVDPRVITILSKSPNVGSGKAFFQSPTTEGPPMKLSVDGRLLSSMVDNFESGSILLEFMGPSMLMKISNQDTIYLAATDHA